MTRYTWTELGNQRVQASFDACSGAMTVLTLEYDNFKMRRLLNSDVATQMHSEYGLLCRSFNGTVSFE